MEECPLGKDISKYRGRKGEYSGVNPEDGVSARHFNVAISKVERLVICHLGHIISYDLPWFTRGPVGDGGDARAEGGLGCGRWSIVDDLGAIVVDDPGAIVVDDPGAIVRILRHINEFHPNGRSNLAWNGSDVSFGRLDFL